MNPLSVILIHSNYTMESKAYCYLFGKGISVIASKVFVIGRLTGIVITILFGIAVTIDNEWIALLSNLSMQQLIIIGLLSQCSYCHCSVIVIGFIKSIFKYNYQFMSIFNILILMVIIHCVGVSVGGGGVFNILISSI